MPKYRPATEKARAKSFAKVCIKHKLNQTRVAEELGITHQAVSARLSRLPVQHTLDEFLNSEELGETLEQVAADALKAERSIGAAILVSKDGTVIKADDEGGITMPDHAARHKFWHDLLVIRGKLKLSGNGNGGGVVITNIIYGYGAKSLNSALRPGQTRESESAKPDATEST